MKWLGWWKSGGMENKRQSMKFSLSLSCCFERFFLERVKRLELSTFCMARVVRRFFLKSLQLLISLKTKAIQKLSLFLQLTVTSYFLPNNTAQIGGSGRESGGVTLQKHYLTSFPFKLIIPQKIGIFFQKLKGIS